MAEEAYDTISDVRHGAAVDLPTLSADESFVLLKSDGENVGVTLYNLTPSEAVDVLMGVVMALNG